MKSEKRDFRKELTDKIIDLMEHGNALWQKPWNTEGGDILAYSLTPSP